MTSAVDICNMALNLLGDEATVVSVFPPEGSMQARMVATAYPFALNSLLESFDWTFARRSVVCSPLETATTDGWRYAFILPSDCLRVRSLRMKERDEPYAPVGHVYGYWDGDSNDIEYTLGVVDKQRVVFTDAYAPVVRYTSKNTEPDLFSPSFATALAYKVALLVAGKMIGDENGVKRVSSLEKSVAREMALARSYDVAQRQCLFRFVPKWISGR